MGIACLLSACGGNGEPDPDDTTPAATPSPAATPTATATPDLLGPPPESASAAIEALGRYFGSSQPHCDQTVLSRWFAECETGDVDGDGADDVAFLVPLSGPGLRSPDPAAVVLRRSSNPDFEQFPAFRTEADGSALGRQMFNIADRTGDGRPELVYLSKGCTASTCRQLVEVQTWDGTAWRDAGPADLGLENMEMAEFAGTGADSVLTARGGRLSSLGAGPSRARTVTYTFDGARYVLATTVYDPPVYLYHAIIDADRLFDDAAQRHGQFEAAIAAYRAALADPSLRDWKFETEGVNGRAELGAYALFRIAVATAASGGNPTSSLDEIIIASDQELFQRIAVAFRQGYQQGSTARHGCLAVTSYLATPPLPARIAEIFDYGTANPPKTTLDICPL